jgi:hypothetical protein
MLAYKDDFALMLIAILVSLPPLLLVRSSRRQPVPPPRMINQCRHFLLIAHGSQGDRSQAGSQAAVALGLPFGDALVAVPISRFRGIAGVNSA